LDPDELAPTALAIARAVGAAHDQGIIHRDLKPENVIRSPDGGVKVLDLGLAAFEQSPLPTEAAGPRLTIPGLLLGTPAYMSPEQLRGEEIDHRADLFAFGIVVFEMAAGWHPFAREDPASTIAMILESDPPDLLDAAPESPPELGRIVTR
jgi:serine/threonine-protein kinase